MQVNCTTSYQQIIETTLTSLTGNVAENGGFHHSTAGNTTITAVALCRGDIGPEDCENCMKTSTPSLQRNYPNQTEAAAWYSNCMIRYSDRKIVGSCADLKLVDHRRSTQYERQIQTY
ncbi:putative Gnk2-like domain-containing protein [Helianthus anomalus]